MDAAQSMELFRELVSCGSNIYTWAYSADGELQSSNCPLEELWDAAFTSFGVKKQMLERRESRVPVTLSTSFGLFWGAAYQREGEALSQICVIGPLLHADVPINVIEQGLRRYAGPDFGVARRNELIQAMHQVPAAQSIVFIRYLLMLHYCLNGEKLDGSDVDFAEVDIPSGEAPSKRDRQMVWLAERSMLQMVRTGDLNYKDALNTSILLSNGVPVNSPDPLRQAKTSIIVFTSIVCRAAIEGGLTPELAYSLGDTYIQEAENAANINALSALARAMYDDFVSRVHKCRTNPAFSKLVRRCCDYIEMHLEDKIRAKDLAALSGYSEYYVTRKFREETGFTVNDYIKFAKIERARLLLETSDLSIQKISERLGFSSRNYFSRVFSEITGLTPAEYREANS